MTARSARFLPLPRRRRHLRRTAAVGRLLDVRLFFTVQIFFRTPI
jgi:hypothetical protein